MKHSLRFGSALAALLLLPALAHAKPLSEGVFVTRLGDDTLSIERFQRDATRVSGEVVRRVPRVTLVNYEVALGRSGRPETATFHLLPPPGTGNPAPPRTIHVTFRSDSTVSEEMRDELVRRAWPLGNAYLWMPDTYGVSELWLGTVKATGSAADTVTVVGPIGGPSGRLPSRRTGPHEVETRYGTGHFRFVTDARGRLQSVDGSTTTTKHIVSRLASFDLDGFAAHAVALEKAGHSLGRILSPRDTTRATVADCELWVDYGRPSKRGRHVFDHGVLGDTLWRTGANAATQLSTSRDLTIGGQRLPAGKYTLWTRAVGNGYALVINSQTGQWGTRHDPARDLMQVPLAMKKLTDEVETFTIEIEPGGGSSGVLRLEWDDTELSVPFEVAS